MLHSNKTTIISEGLITHLLKIVYEYMLIFIKKKEPDYFQKPMKLHI